jgi:hypothetical protein
MQHEPRRHPRGLGNLPHGDHIGPTLTEQPQGLIPNNSPSGPILSGDK